MHYCQDEDYGEYGDEDYGDELLEEAKMGGG